ncbi:hypothetical protein LQW54_008503 [Pestalotiopsis sp. IQ-011]
MRGSFAVAVASLPLISAQLNLYVQKVGLKYFGTATDSPYRRPAGNYSEYDAILRDHAEFDQWTSENGQKWEFTEPEQGVFNFMDGDIVTHAAQENDMMLRCHNLVWYMSLPEWVESTNWTAEALSEVIVNHITNVMEHYKGQCYAWDVVNEALNDDGTYRESVFYKTQGEEYIKLAFSTAAQVDPDSKLYSNDYSIESPRNKSDGALRIVKLLQDDGIRIDRVGMQAHFVASLAPSFDDQAAVIESFAALGVEVAYTELDVMIELPSNETNLEWQRQAYTDATSACISNEACIGITVWDFHDPFSWVPEVVPGYGAAQLWFEDYSKHPAYYDIIEALKNGTGIEERHSRDPRLGKNLRRK